MQSAVIEAKDQDAHRALLDSMFRFRKKIFIDRLKWGSPGVVGDYEYDFWDTPIADPVYIVCYNERGVVACQRYVRSTRPTMFELVFPDYLYEPHPKSDALVETTRVGVDPALSPVDQQRAKLLLFLTSGEWSVGQGVAQSMMVTNRRVFEASQNVRRHVQLGPVMPDDNVAILGDFSQQANDERRRMLRQLDEGDAGREQRVV